jgi:hypothetical protein
MASILDVVQTIQNIVSTKGYDGALDEEGNPVKIGLKREVDNTVIDSRLVDGFKVRFQGNNMILSYSSECSIKNVANPKFEGMVGQKIADIVNFIKKEYKASSGSALSLKQEGETDILVQKMSNIRTWYQTTSIYNIGGLSADQGSATVPPAQRLEESIKNWLKTARQ